MKKRDTYAELPVPHSCEEMDLDKVLRMNFNRESTVTHMRHIQLQLPSLHTYGIGHHSNVRLYLELLPAELTAHYAPSAISETYHYSNAVSTPFIYAKHHLGKPDKGHDVDDLTHFRESSGLFQSTQARQFEETQDTTGEAHPPNLYKSKLVHIGVVNAEEHTEDDTISSHSTPFAAVGQVEGDGHISGIYAIPLDLKDDEEEDEMSPSRWYDLDDLWKPNTVGVYYLGKTIGQCRNSEWKLVSNSPVEVIHIPTDE